MAAKNIGAYYLNRLTNLPDQLTIDRILRHEHCDEYFVSYVPPNIRHCPYCGSADCVIKDSGYKVLNPMFSRDPKFCLYDRIKWTMQKNLQKFFSIFRFFCRLNISWILFNSSYIINRN